MHHEGLGGPKDFPTSAELYRKAARSGDSSAMWNLALSYLYGEGVSKSRRWARFWLEKAKELGHLDATRVLKEQFQTETSD